MRQSLELKGSHETKFITKKITCDNVQN